MSVEDLQYLVELVDDKQRELNGVIMEAVHKGCRSSHFEDQRARCLNIIQVLRKEQIQRRI